MSIFLNLGTGRFSILWLAKLKNTKYIKNICIKIIDKIKINH